jgi:outer membrane lipoprotein-sorting protein
MKMNMVKIAGVVVVVAALSVGGCKKKNETVGQAVDRNVDKTEEVAHDVVEGTKDAAGKAVDKTGEVLEKTGDAIEDAGEKMQK